MSYSEYTCNVKKCNNTEWIANVPNPIPHPDTFWCQECCDKASNFKFISRKDHFFKVEIESQNKAIAEYQSEIEQFKHQIESLEIRIGWSLKKIDILEDEKELYQEDFDKLKDFDSDLLETMVEADYFENEFPSLLNIKAEKEGKSK